MEKINEKRMKKYYLTGIIAGIFSLTIGITAFAGVWQKDGVGWWYDNGDGTWLDNGWAWIDGNGDGISECYYFNQEGYCLTNTFAPDGSIVDSNGAWILNGIVQTKYVGKNADKDSRMIYLPVLEQYKEAINHYFYPDVLRYDSNIPEIVGEYVNEYLLRTAGYSDMSEIYYAFVDIDGNGTEELLIGLSDAELSEPHCFDVFGYNGKRIIRLFDDNFTARTFFTLYKNGIMAVEGSSGAAYSNSSYYRIEQNGCHAELIEEIVYDGSYDPLVKSKYFYYSKETIYTEEVNETEYVQILAKYESMEKYTIKWEKL